MSGAKYMYKNKANDRNNISVTVIKKCRQEKQWSQREISISYSELLSGVIEPE